MNVGDFREALDEFGDDVPVALYTAGEWVEVDGLVLGLDGADPVALLTVPAPSPSLRGGEKG